MRKQLIKGNEAVVKAAILAGCRAFYGYPITPASEIAEAAALYLAAMPAAFFCRRRARWRRSTCCTAPRRPACAHDGSSGPGISLMQEGFSYLAGAELPCVVADIMRGGPGLGNIAPEQSDYHQIVKAAVTGTIARWCWRRIPCRRWAT